MKTNAKLSNDEKKLVYDALNFKVSTSLGMVEREKYLVVIDKLRNIL